MEQVSLFEDMADKKKKPDVFSDIRSLDLESIVRRISQREDSSDSVYVNLGRPYHYGYIPRLEVIRNRIVLESGGEKRERHRYDDFDLVLDQYYEDGDGRANYCGNLLYVDINGKTWTAKLNLAFDREVSLGNIYGTGGTVFFQHGWPHFLNASITEWKLSNRLLKWDEYVLANKRDQLWKQMEETKPYTYRFAKERGVWMPEILYMAPELEQLSKAGYSFADRFLALEDRFEFRTMHRGYEEYDDFNRLCKPGNNPKEIFKTSKDVYSVLIHEEDMQIWDMYRKMYKSGKVEKDTIRQSYESRLTAKDLSQMNDILSKKYKGKPVFTWTSLQNYMHRLDMFQAIDKKEGFQLLKDYLSQCAQLDMEPRIDSDSLKREHDVATRLVYQKAQAEWEKRQEEEKKLISQDFETASEHLKENDYTEDVFFIRGIRSYDDLLDEAKQQHNCVASYASMIRKGQAYIYVMRETDKPDKSLITVEIDPGETCIRQKFLAYNQSIRNRAQTEFLDRWLKLVRERRRMNARSVQELADVKTNDKELADSEILEDTETLDSSDAFALF